MIRCNSIALSTSRSNSAVATASTADQRAATTRSLRNAAGVPGFIRFAVGRTPFWDALVALRDGKSQRRQAVEDIASRYIEWARVFEQQSAN